MSDAANDANVTLLPDKRRPAELLAEIKRLEAQLAAAGLPVEADPEPVTSPPAKRRPGRPKGSAIRTTRPSRS